MELHREIKSDMLTLLEGSAKPNWTKQRINDEQFKIFMKLKGEK